MNTLNAMTLDDRLQWLKGVAGVDSAYLSKWDRSEWSAWEKAMTADPNDENPIAPSWMQPHIAGEWSKDWGQPFPCIGQLWPTAHDWFAEHATREDFQLSVEAPLVGEAPSVKRLQEAWDYAKAYNAVPMVMMNLLPPTPTAPAIVGEIEAFYVVSAIYDELIEIGVSSTVGSVGDRVGSVLGKNVLGQKAGIGTADEVHVIYSWEWMG